MPPGPSGSPGCWSSTAKPSPSKPGTFAPVATLFWIYRAQLKTAIAPLLSYPNDYLNAIYTQPEWAAAWNQDPSASDRKLLPVRVGPCKPTGLLASIAYVDLVGKSETEAETLLLAALKERGKPATRPGFPQVVPDQERITSGTVAFPQDLPEQAAQSVNSSTALRLALVQNLASLPGPQFEQVLFALSPPPGNVASAQAPQGNRVKNLLDWATSIGPGLSEVEAVYNLIIRPR